MGNRVCLAMNMEHKSLVIDGRKAFVSSANWPMDEQLGEGSASARSHKLKRITFDY